MSAEVPACIGIIPDGNRRWARARGIPSIVGHRRGSERVRDIVTWAAHRDIPHLVVYVFSTENWQRSPAEVAGLMKLLGEALGRVAREVPDTVRFVCLGDRECISAALRERIQQLERATAHRTGTVATLLLSYGGRAEIVDAVNRAIASGVSSVDENAFGALLEANALPDPDLIIRTSGEQRLSNFLPWQSVYSELFFTETLWPDFTEAEFDRILEWYASRNRRRGA